MFTLFYKKWLRFTLPTQEGDRPHRISFIYPIKTTLIKLSQKYCVGSISDLCPIEICGADPDEIYLPTNISRHLSLSDLETPVNFNLPTKERETLKSLKKKFKNFNIFKSDLETPVNFNLSTKETLKSVPRPIDL